MLFFFYSNLNAEIVQRIAIYFFPDVHTNFTKLYFSVCLSDLAWANKLQVSMATVSHTVTVHVSSTVTCHTWLQFARTDMQNFTADEHTFNL